MATEKTMPYARYAVEKRALSLLGIPFKRQVDPGPGTARISIDELSIKQASQLNKLIKKIFKGVENKTIALPEVHPKTSGPYDQLVEAAAK